MEGRKCDISAKLLQRLIFFLADIVADFVKSYKAGNPVYGQRLPPRTLALATRTPHVAMSVVCGCMSNYCSVATVVLTRSDTGDGDEQQEDSPVSLSSRSKLNLGDVWNFINECQTKHVSVEALAKTRSEDARGGVKVSAVLFWARKFLSVYHKRCQLSFLQENRVVIATDASTHACRDVLVSLFFSPMSNVRLCSELLTLMSLEPSPQLGLLPLKSGDLREFSNEKPFAEQALSLRRA